MKKTLLLSLVDKVKGYITWRCNLQGGNFAWSWWRNQDIFVFVFVCFYFWKSKRLKIDLVCWTAMWIPCKQNGVSISPNTFFFFSLLFLSPAERRGDMVMVGDVPSVRPSHSSVRNSSYSSYAISTKLSQNDCHQVPQRILSVFCDSINLLRSYCPLFKFTLCATPPTVLNMRFEPKLS